MEEITPIGFRDRVRETLRYRHDFEHHDLERADALFKGALEKLKVPGGLRAKHLEDAMEEMRAHDDWKRFSPRKQEALETALKQHLTIKEEPGATPE